MIDKGNFFIVRISERLIIPHTDIVRNQIDKILEEKNQHYLILDLENVSECDSDGLRFFLTVYRKAHKLGKECFLFRPGTFLRELFELSNLHNFFTIIDTLDDFTD